MLATEVRDPGIGLVTLTRVKVSADLSMARVYWTIMGDEKDRAQTAKALGRTAPYMRHLLSGRMSLRRVPEIRFYFDESVAAQDRIEHILLDLKAEREARAEEADGAAAELDAARPADEEPGD